MENQKSLEEKTILEKHTLEGKFNLGSALVDMDTRIKVLTERANNAHDALEFMVKWYEEQAKNKIQEIKPKIELL